MWISRIELTNFKSYRHQVFEFPGPTDGRNLVLIGGLNGYGKTSILEALYLCLYGKDALVHLARAGLNSDDTRGYPTFLERAFNGEAKRDGRDTMTVRVVVHRTKTKAVDITRKWYFRSNGSWAADEEAIVRSVIRDIPESPRVDGKNGFHLSDFLDEIFVPAHVAPFFFFDGEEVKKLADQSRVEQVKQGLEGLLGVVLLRTLADRLKNFEASKRGDVTSVNEEKLGRVLDELTRNEAQLSTIGIEAKAWEDETNRLRAEREALIGRVTAAGGGGGDIATVKDLVEEREQLRTKRKDCLKKIEEVLAGRLPFHLVTKDLMSSFKGQLQAEIRWFSWENEKKALEPRKAQFEQAFLDGTSPAFTPPLSDTQVQCIRERLETAWASLFYPPPADAAAEIVHDYLQGSMRGEALAFLDSIPLGQQEVQELLGEQSSLSHRIDELGRKVSRLEGIDRDGTLAALKQQLEAVQTRLDEIAESARISDRKLVALEATVASQRSEYQRERHKLDESSPVRAMIQKSERIRNVLDEVIPALFPLKVKQLATAMTSVYKALAHKDLVAKIDILDDGTTIILGKSGKEISVDRSAGENQIFATALIAGLAKVSGVRAPMVVDTPLGRLDSKHRENILKFWTSDANKQVILLSQDEEIDHSFYKQIQPNVCKSYLLEHVDVGDGIGRTTAKENAYFAKGRK